MTDIQTRTERMAESCLELLDTEPIKTIVQASNIWKLRRNNLEAQIGAIDDIEINQEVNITGIAIDKEALKITMAQLGYTMCQKISSLAHDMNSDTLLSEINFRYSYLANVKDATAVTRCQTIKNRASALIASPPPAPIVFADYDINVAGANALQQAIDNFKAEAGKPKSAKTLKIASTEDLDHAFDDLDKILLLLDTNANTLRFSNHTLWEQWQAARKRDDTGVRHLRARIFLIDDVTSAKVGQGFVAIPALNITKKVTKRSLATIKDAEVGIGTYDLLAKANLYLDQPLPNVVFEEGKLTRLIVRMKKP